MKHTNDIQSAVTNIRYYADKIKELCGKQADNLPNESNNIVVNVNNVINELALINDSDTENIKTCCNIILERLEEAEL